MYAYNFTGGTKMNITDVHVKKIQVDGKLKGVSSITIDDEFVINDIKIIEGNDGLFIAMPSKKTPKGTFRDIAHPISQEARTQISQLVLEAYEKALLEPDEDNN